MPTRVSRPNLGASRHKQRVAKAPVIWPGRRALSARNASVTVTVFIKAKGVGTPKTTRYSV